MEVKSGTRKRAKWSHEVKLFLIRLLKDHDVPGFRTQNAWSKEAWTNIVCRLNAKYAYMMGPVGLIGDIAASAAPKPTAVTELFSVEDPKFGQYKFQLSVPQTALGRDQPSFKINAVKAVAPLNAVNNQIETHGSSSNVISQTSEAKDHPPANAIPVDPTTSAKM
ncbi:hypothetical protein EJB05_46719 [Eragrostis curvula]|uniref:Myb/SANT-like domain-containing protein n=1 Tax=Eragrostis curvula TaxID=38414 RepID=A0A5J9TNX3_9POAL|nr:hypothetical protein EJB05_46719 [Eragrostis curvula]